MALPSSLAWPCRDPTAVIAGAARTRPPEPPGAYSTARGRFNDDIYADLPGYGS